MASPALHGILAISAPPRFNFFLANARPVPERMYTDEISPCAALFFDLGSERNARESPAESAFPAIRPARGNFLALILALIAGRRCHTSKRYVAPSFLICPAVGVAKWVPMTRIGLSAQSFTIALRVAIEASLSLSKAGAHSGCAIWQG